MRRVRGQGAVLVAGAALAAATMVTTLGGPASATSTKSGHAVVIDMVKVPKVGTVLTTSAGRTLYRFTADPSGMATCTGACATAWPPLIIPKGDHLKGPAGVKGLSTIHLPNGHLQASFRNAALYRFSGDKKKGQAKGQGVEGKWFALVPSTFTALAKHPASTTTSPTTGTPMPTTPATTPATTPPTTPATPANPPMLPTTPATTPPTTPTTSPPPPPTTTTPPVGGGAGF